MKKLLATVALLALAACESAPQTYTPSPISFASEGPIRLNVAQIRVVENYRSPMSPPNVEHQFATTPANAVKQWVRDRLQAVGTTGTLDVAIDDASVKETLLPKTTGIKGLFTNDQDARFDASLRVSMRLYDGINPSSLASGDVSVTRFKTISERSTVDDRTRLFDGMTRDVMDTYNDAAEARLNQFFGPYIVKSR